MLHFCKSSSDEYMHKVFTHDDLNDPINCPQCSWKGKGADTKKEDLFLTDAIELYCPDCETYLGLLNNEEMNR